MPKWLSEVSEEGTEDELLPVDQGIDHRSGTRRAVEPLAGGGNDDDDDEAQ